MTDSPEASPLYRYLTRGAIIYYALVLPAIVAELVFSVAIASTPGGVVPPGAPYSDLVGGVVEVLPWLILLASAYAVFTFRPSVLVTLLVASFFVAASLVNGIVVFGAQLDLGDTVILVVAAAFLALVGFNYARGLRLLGTKRADVTSSGPVGYNVLGLALDSAVPLAAAAGLVLLVEAVVAGLDAQAARLPEPLSTLASTYLSTRVGLVFTTIFVAGATIWVLRQFIEPVILHFTLSPSDARKELLYEIEPTTKTVRKLLRYRPSRGLAWGVLVVAYSLGIFAALVLFTPQAELSRDLAAIFTLKSPSATPAELLLDDAFQNALLKVDILFAQSQDYLREIIRILWG